MTNKINPEELKQVRRRRITGVAIASGYHQGTTHGMTANNFNSLALSPPTVIVNLHHSTRTQKIIKDGWGFGVSILNSKQLNLMKRFAGEIDQRRSLFKVVEKFTMTTGAPLIAKSSASLNCEVVHSFDVGSTTVFIEEALEARIAVKDQEP